MSQLRLIKNDTEHKAGRLIRLTDVRKGMAKLCEHNNWNIDDRLDVCFCKDCGIEMNAINLLKRMCDKGSFLAYQEDKLQELKKQIDAKSKCKCKHCGKMTNIN